MSERSMKQIREVRKDLHLMHYDLHTVENQLGLAERALDALERAMADSGADREQKDRDVVRSYQRWETRPADQPSRERKIEITDEMVKRAHGVYWSPHGGGGHGHMRAALEAALAEFADQPSREQKAANMLRRIATSLDDGMLDTSDVVDAVMDEIVDCLEDE